MSIMKCEEWADIKGYEGWYQVSNMGRVRSVDHYVKSPTRNPEIVKMRIVKGKLLKPEIKANGYLYVSLWKEGIKKAYTVHRLVAEAFVDNPLAKPFVNHKDYNRQNASAENLEWVTANENMQYSSCNLSTSHIGKSSFPNKTGEMYISQTPCGHYRLQIDRLGIRKTYNTIKHAVEARKVIIGW